MIIPIGNYPMPYAWGSRDQIAALCAGGGAYLMHKGASVGILDSGPEAELWLGDHVISPSRFLHECLGCSNLLEFTSLFVDFDAKTGKVVLNERFYRAQSAKAEGGAEQAAPELAPQSGKLPFLMKIISAAAPLSLQLHPPLEFAQKGYAREQSLGVPIVDQARSYKDNNHKPEMLFALEDGFCAAVGVLPRGEAAAVVCDIVSFLKDESDGELSADHAVRALSFFELLASRIASGSRLTDVLQFCLAGSAGQQNADTPACLSALLRWSRSPNTNNNFALLKQNIRSILRHFPEDRGVLGILLLHQVCLSRGECMYIPPGTLHAYIGGLGLEVMASSDNVLRAGMTQKYINMPEILRILDGTNFPESASCGDLLCPPVCSLGRAVGAGDERDKNCSFEIKEYRPACGSFVLTCISLCSDVLDSGASDAQHSPSIFSAPAIIFCAMGGATVQSKSCVADSRSAIDMQRGDAVFVADSGFCINPHKNGCILFCLSC